MGDFLQTLVNAVTIGSLYALIALGYTMVYGILQLINFAHSDIVVLGAWVSYTLATFLLPRMGIDVDSAPWYAGGAILIASMILCGAIGFCIERLAYKPIRRAPRLNALITAIGVSLFLQNTGQLHYTIIPAEKQLAAGKVLDRGTDPKSIKLDAPITIGSGNEYQLRLQAADATTPTVRKIISPPATYERNQELMLDQPIGRAQTRDASFTLVSISSPLQLPFGAMPAGMPHLMPDNELWRHEFNTSIRNEDGTISSIAKPVRITGIDATIVGTALLLMIGLEMLIFHTRLGMAMRAVSFNFDTAGLMGIAVDRIISITFVTGAALAAAAGFLYAIKYQQIQQPAHQTWVLLGLKAFVAAVIGGIGNVRGAAIGGFLIAFIEQFSGVYLQRFLHWDNAAAFTDVYVFALLILMLLVRPRGLFGSTVREKV
ncbi:MAG TPA: branched-chain amino acid ABC transporter permease [Tepidisphaeraceae bacterium]|nr:branched-chain amino acid ABC transporter permease [Tepidisphaeraceae bacterium]